MNDILEPFIKNDIENSLLSLFIMDHEEIFKHEIHEDLFTEYRHLVFNGILELVNNGLIADLTTLSSNLSGKVKVSDLNEIIDTPVSLNARYHIKALEKALLIRRLYNSFRRGLEMCRRGDDPAEIESATRIADLNFEKTNSIDSNQLAINTVSSIENEVIGEKRPGLMTGFRRLDNNLGGLLPSEVLVIGGRPGMGKTAFALNMARNFGFSGHGGIIFSLEMSNEQLFKRLICDVAEVDGSYLFQGRLKKQDSDTWEKIHKAAESLSTTDIVWDATPHMTVEKIVARTKRIKASREIKWIIIDYLQLLKGWGSEGQGPKAEISRQLKLLAKELQITVIILSQLSRLVDGRADKIPILSDLRDCGAIEQDADLVFFPHVPQKAIDGTSCDQYESANLYIAKARRGRIGAIRDMKWQGHYYRYSDNGY